MTRRHLVAAVLVTVVLAAPATGDPGDEKQRLDNEIQRLRTEIQRAEQQEGVLTSEISAVNARVRDVQSDIADEQSKLTWLENRLTAERQRLERLNIRFVTQTERLRVLEKEHHAAVVQLETRLRRIYMEDTPDAFSFVLGASSFSDLLDHVELLNDIGRQDARIADRVAKSEFRTKVARRKTSQTRASVQATTRSIAGRVEEQRAARDSLVAIRDELAAAQSAKARTLASVRAEHGEHETELDQLEAESAALAAQIRAAQQAAAAAAAAAASGASSATTASSNSTISAAGLIWPVSGPVVSGFGPRDGRMHEGIDISVASGTPVVASATGTVIHSGWLGGYGNLVVIDHGNGLSTAYAHNSALAVVVGQQVAQGEVISYAGTTGNSSGPHVHFEVRVNGTAVDPLGYL
jgi:murein DD-endopeptidase MepM/ murein hydrolase activator NlpD